MSYHSQNLLPCAVCVTSNYLDPAFHYFILGASFQSQHNAVWNDLSTFQCLHNMSCPHCLQPSNLFFKTFSPLPTIRSFKSLLKRGRFFIHGASQSPTVREVEILIFGQITLISFPWFIEIIIKVISKYEIGIKTLIQPAIGARCSPSSKTMSGI